MWARGSAWPRCWEAAEEGWGGRLAAIGSGELGVGEDAPGWGTAHERGINEWQGLNFWPFSPL